jgi:hypothetical protein
VGLERGPLSLVSITEELLERRSSGSGLESRDYGSKDPLQKLALTSATSGGLSVGIVRTRTQAMEYFVFAFCDRIKELNERMAAYCRYCVSMSFRMFYFRDYLTNFYLT